MKVKSQFRTSMASQSPYTPKIRAGRFVFHFPMVKSGKSMGRLRSATDFSLKAQTWDMCSRPMRNFWDENRYRWKSAFQASEPFSIPKT